MVVNLCNARHDCIEQMGVNDWGLYCEAGLSSNNTSLELVSQQMDQ